MSEEYNPKGRKQRKTVSLVLGSGGARGLAHIGVIEELEAQGYQIKAISGSSMGALVGGVHALGKLEIYREWVEGLSQSDVIGLLDWSFSGGGMIRGNKLMRKLKDLVGESDIEELPISYTAVAVDIHRGREVWMSDGSLFDAIRASIAIPAVFAPHSYRGRTLVDGGLLNPVPVAPTLRTLTDLTIVVDANGSASRADSQNNDEDEEHTSLMRRMMNYVESLGVTGPSAAEGMALSEVLMRSLETMQAALTRHHLAVFRPDLVISIPKNTCMVHEFHRAKPVVELGRTLAREQLEALSRMQPGRSAQSS